MDEIRAYLVSVVAACMISVPAMVFVRKESLQKTVRLIGGVLILLVVLRPILHMDLGDISQRLRHFTDQYHFDTSEISETMQSQMAKYVKENSERVIEQKASELGGILQAEVRVSDGELPTPIHVKLTGSMPQNQLVAMKDYLQTAFQIPPEEQEWRLYETLQ